MNSEGFWDTFYKLCSPKGSGFPHRFVTSGPTLRVSWAEPYHIALSRLFPYPVPNSKTWCCSQTNTKHLMLAYGESR